MPLVKEKPREAENICSESLKNCFRRSSGGNTLNKHTSGSIKDFNMPEGKNL